MMMMMMMMFMMMFVMMTVDAAMALTSRRRSMRAWTARVFTMSSSSVRA